MQQSGAMCACIEYMCSRMKQNLQVSKLEKFGYGNIITQIAGTACGMLELEKIGKYRKSRLHRYSYMVCNFLSST